MPKPEQLLSPADLDAAKAAWRRRTQEKHDPDAVGTTRSLGNTSLLGTLDADVRAAKETSKTGFDGPSSINNPEIEEEFEEAIKIYTKIFAGAGITMPTLEELTQGGINFGRLAELKETHPNHDLVVAPLTLSFKTTRQLVAAVAHDKTIRNNPLLKSYRQTKTSSSGLCVNEDVVGVWSSIVWGARDNWKLPTADNEQEWTAFLLPGGDKPENLGISYNEMKKQGLGTTPLVGYLAYQMKRIHQDLPPVDNAMFTWVEGYPGAILPPYVGWEADSGQIYVGQVVARHSYDKLGIRSPLG